MSIINKMLQDLDRRQGMASPETTPPLSQVRTVAPARKDREWFWRWWCTPGTAERVKQLLGSP